MHLIGELTDQFHIYSMVGSGPSTMYSSIIYKKFRTKSRINFVVTLPISENWFYTLKLLHRLHTEIRSVSGHLTLCLWMAVVTCTCMIFKGSPLTNIEVVSASGKLIFNAGSPTVQIP